MKREEKLFAEEAEAVLDREDLGLLVEVILMGHEVAAGGDAEGTVLDGLELGGVSGADVSELGGHA